MQNFLPWKILHLDLSRGMVALPREKGSGGIFVVFWSNGIPLGQLVIHSDYLPKTASQVLEMALDVITAPVGDHLLSDGFKDSLPLVASKKSIPNPPKFSSLIKAINPLEKLKSRKSLLKISTSRLPTISLVICTRDRTEFLKRCLLSIERAHPRPNEIIIVDNSPTSDDTYALVKDIRWITYIRECRPGLSVARNTGLRKSRCDIVAFTDDDVTVHPDWILRLKYAFKNPNILSVTGLILPSELQTKAQFFFQNIIVRGGWGYRSLLFDSVFFQKMKNRGVPVWQIGAGANMAFRRQAFKIFGEFDERLGAGSAGCSEDSEIWYRILAAGWKCFYDPTAVVYHHHRKDMKALKNQMYYYMRGHVAALVIQFEKYHHWGNLYRALLTLPHYYLKRITKSSFRFELNVNSTLASEISGYLHGWIYYLITKAAKVKTQFLNNWY